MSESDELERVRERGFDILGDGWVDIVVFALGTGFVPGIARVVVVLTGGAGLQLSTAGDLYLFDDGLAGLELGHSINRCKLFWDDEGIKSHGSALHFFFKPMGNRDTRNESVQVFFGFVLHGFFSTTEHDFDFDFVSLGQEFLGLSLFEEEIVGIGSKAETNTLGFYFFLLRLLLLFLLGRLVLKFAVVGNLADRRFGEGGYLDQVSLLFLSEEDGIGRVHDSSIHTVLVNNHDLRDENLLIDTSMLLQLNFRLGAIVASSSHGIASLAYSFPSFISFSSKVSKILKN